MDNLLLSVGFGWYVSLIKMAIFLVFFFGWVGLINWVYKDAIDVEADDVLWTSVVGASGVISTILWLLVPFFTIGIVIFICLVGIGGMMYVKDRNSRVMEYDRVLTAEHIKGLISSSHQQKLEEMREFVFITANDNKIPVPEPKTKEFYGYKTAYDLMRDAIYRRASNISFVPGGGNYQVVYTIDGVGFKRPSIENTEMGYLLHFVKQAADLDTEERRKPQRGYFFVKESSKEIKWEVSTAGSTAGEQMKLKDVTEEEIKKIDKLGLIGDQQKVFDSLKDANKGLFLISGPKKSGVTSTFYAVLKDHDAFLNSIETLEKEEVTNLPNIEQYHFRLSDTGTSSYAQKLRSIVRMGPDIVGVSDVDDSETAIQAAEAAENGVLIYVSLNANSAAEALAKWLKMVGEKQQAFDNILGVSNQRLVRALCNECKQGYTPKKEMLHKFNLPAEKAKVLYRAGKVVYDKHGKESTCEKCQGTGFFGRTAIFETVLFNKEQQKELQKCKSLKDISSVLRHAKMRNIQNRGLQKVLQGETSINEMIRVVSGSGNGKKQKSKSK